MPLRTARYAIAGALALAGCATPAVVDSHATVPARMFTIASRFEQDRRQGGMTAVTTDIERCYAVGHSAGRKNLRASGLPRAGLRRLSDGRRHRPPPVWRRDALFRGPDRLRKVDQIRPSGAVRQSEPLGRLSQQREWDGATGPRPDRSSALAPPQTSGNTRDIHAVNEEQDAKTHHPCPAGPGG